MGSPSGSEPPLPAASAHIWGPGEEARRVSCPSTGQRRPAPRPARGVGWGGVGWRGDGFWQMIPHHGSGMEPLRPCGRFWSRNPLSPGAKGRSCFQSCLKIIPGYTRVVTSQGRFLWGEEVEGSFEGRSRSAPHPPFSHEERRGPRLEDFFFFEFGGDRGFYVL